MVDDDEDGEFDLVSDEELDPNSTISTSVCEVYQEVLMQQYFPP